MSAQKYIMPQRFTFTLGCSNCGKKFISASTSENLIYRGIPEDERPGLIGNLLMDMADAIKVEFGDFDNHESNCDRPILAAWREE